MAFALRFHSEFYLSRSEPVLMIRKARLSNALLAFRLPPPTRNRMVRQAAVEECARVNRVRVRWLISFVWIRS